MSSKHSKNEYWAKVDEQGRLVLPDEVREEYGIRPNTQVYVKTGSKSLRVHRPISHLARVYIEPTTRCNLACSTCIRNTWQEPQGDLSEEDFDRLVAALKTLPSKPEVFFGGFGEPLLVPGIAEWVRRTKEAASKVELITNGLLLTEKMSRELTSAGLDILWVSLDGATPENFADVRPGAELEIVFANLERFSSLRDEGRFRTEIGISFVAMKRNIQELPALLQQSERLGAARYLVTNVYPYTLALHGERLYPHSLEKMDSHPSPHQPHIDLPRMDFGRESKGVLAETLYGRTNVHLNNVTLGQGRYRCPFIERGAVTVGWDGSVSPCLELMHNHPYYLDKEPRQVRRWTPGKVSAPGLITAWESADYLEFRRRVEAQDLPDKGETGDDLVDALQTCASCPWAQGVIQCP